VVKQFDAFEPIPGMHIQRHVDPGGETSPTWAARHRVRRLQACPAGCARCGPAGWLHAGAALLSQLRETWRFKHRPEALRARLLTDEHAPPKYRVLGPLANLEEFAAAFQCRPGDAMVRPPDARVKLW